MHVQEPAQGVVNVEKLDQERDAPDDFNVGGGHEIDGLVFGDAPEAGDEADDAGEKDGGDGDLEGDDDAVGQVDERRL